MKVLIELIKLRLKSKTINAASLIVIIGYIQSQTDFLSQFMTPSQLGGFISFLGVVMYVLRELTSTPVNDKAK